MDFARENELGTDAGGLTTEAIERFATSFASAYHKKHPRIFKILEDSHIAIKGMPKTAEDKNIISNLLFATKSIIIHAGHFPTLCDPALSISIFNY